MSSVPLFHADPNTTTFVASMSWNDRHVAIANSMHDGLRPVQHDLLDES